MERRDGKPEASGPDEERHRYKENAAWTMAARPEDRPLFDGPSLP